VARRPRPDDEKKVDIALGARLARLRKERGFTQIELADKLGVAQSLISSYETGRLRIPPAIVVSITKVLQISSDELLGMVSARAREAPLSRRFSRRLKQVQHLPKRDQDALLRTIDAFLAARKAS
jgi:transcriptional regulator with XRE-family HTH domain